MSNSMEWTTPADCRAAAAAYRNRLGWPVFVHGSIVWMAPGVVADALNVPAQIGLLAVNHLLRTGVDLPVIHLPGPPDRLALLAEPDARPPWTVIDLFTGHDVGYAHGGYDQGHTSAWGIDLPPTQHSGGPPLTWHRSPTIRRPELRLVAHAVVTVLTSPADRPHDH